MLSQAQIHRRVDAAQGKIPCDLLFRDATYLDVFSCVWRKGDVAVVDGTIVALDPGLKAKREIDAKGKWLVPGFIDAHVHVESSMLVPSNFAHAVLPRGTTTAICDPHELANVQGVSGIEYFLSAAETLPLDLRVMLSSCVPATHLETNGGGAIGAEALKKLSSRSKALGLAEMMNVPGVLFGDPEVTAKLEAFSDSIIDGHCPLVSGRALSAYAASGVKSCHESTRLDEAEEKLTKGISVWIREGSVAKDLQALAPLLTLATSTSVGFCTDDRNPLDIASEGHVDHLVRGAIRRGIPPEVAYRAASWSVARHYGLRTKGAVAPGYEADLILLNDPRAVALGDVFRMGVPVKELSFPTPDRATAGTSVRAKAPETADLLGPSGRVHVIGVQPGKILTTRHVLSHDTKGVARLSVLERYGRGS
jgi:adenine deaminase